VGDPARYTGPFLLYWRPHPLVASIIGLSALLVTPWIVRGLASLDRWWITGMLSWLQLPERVEAVERQRDQAVGSAAAQLRRIERDLHDGAQARMVALAMELGRAREDIEENDDPRRAARRIAAAHEEAKLALAELRDLAHGIYPAVLTDLGLDGAVQMLTARCSLPVTADLDVPERPNPVVETTAYLCIAELLTNVAKHAGATVATVRVRRITTPLGGDQSTGNQLRIEVYDDGAGGAVAAPGGGLAGLTDRAESVGGRLEISSPISGPTVVTVELPCAS
jgi:signal transduction histidine kinase